MRDTRHHAQVTPHVVTSSVHGAGQSHMAVEWAEIVGRLHGHRVARTFAELAGIRTVPERPGHQSGTRCMGHASNFDANGRGSVCLVSGGL